MHLVKVCSKSTTIAAYCSGKHWSQGTEKYFTLPNFSVEVFQEYWEWIYSGTISFTRCTQESEPKNKYAELMMLVDIYRAGSRLGDVQLRNVATLEMSKSLQVCDIIPDRGLSADVWAMEPLGTCMRKLFLNFMVGRVRREMLGQTLSQYPSKFIQDIALAALQKAPVVDWELALADKLQYLEPEPKDKT